VGLLAVNIAPSLLAPKALAARNRAQAKLQPYYVNHLDEGDDVVALIKDRAAMNRRLGIPDDEISTIELSMPWVATTNTIPSLFWFFVHVFASPDLVARIRAEVETVTAVETDPVTGRRTAATVDVTRFEKECLTLYACYREVLRLYSDTLGNRRVMADTTLRDPDSDREYLVLKGINVQWPTKIPHLLPSV
jgi:cytochrome P450